MKKVTFGEPYEYPIHIPIQGVNAGGEANATKAIPILHTHTSFPYSVQGTAEEIFRGASFVLRLVGCGLRLVWYWLKTLGYWLHVAWIFARFAFFLWLSLVLVWDFTELLGIPVIEDFKAGLQKGFDSASHLFVKESPVRIPATKPAVGQANPNQRKGKKGYSPVGAVPLPAHYEKKRTLALLLSLVREKTHWRGLSLVGRDELSPMNMLYEIME